MGSPAKSARDERATLRANPSLKISGVSAAHDGEIIMSNAPKPPAQSQAGLAGEPDPVKVEAGRKYQEQFAIGKRERARSQIAEALAKAAAEARARADALKKS